MQKSWTSHLKDGDWVVFRHPSSVHVQCALSTASMSIQVRLSTAPPHVWDQLQRALQRDAGRHAAEGRDDQDVLPSEHTQREAGAMQHESLLVEEDGLQAQPWKDTCAQGHAAAK